MPVVATAAPRVDDPPVGDTRNGVAMTDTIGVEAEWAQAVTSLRELGLPS